MVRSSFYIKPQLGIYSNFDAAFNPEAEILDYHRNMNWDFDVFFKYQKYFVLAKPGLGKTELLKNIESHSGKFNKECIYIDCKKIRGDSIESYISKQINDIKSLNITKIVNSENILICFDALDEIKYDDFSKRIEYLKSFIDKYDKIRILISCRRHYFAKHKTLFQGYDFHFVRIFSFDTRELNQYLTHFSLSHKDIEKIITLFSRSDAELILKVPRYLFLLTSYIEKNSIDNIGKITRADLFEHFIYSKLEIEASKIAEEEREYFKENYKRVLEKLALIMEIYQTNIIKKDELITFFDDIKSNLTIILQDRINLNMFYEKSILKDSVDHIEFENTEFQKYLAAKEISRLGKNKRILFELAVEPVMKEIFPSWFNTLQFLVDMDISLVKPLLEFNRKRENKITEDEEYHRLLTNVNMNRLDLEDRKAIFEQVFHYYQWAGQWLSWDVARNLALYFDASQQNLFENYLNEAEKLSDAETKEVCLSNIAKIVGYIVGENILSPESKENWKTRLIDFANLNSANKVLSRTAIYSLANFNDEAVINKIAPAWEYGDSLVKDAFMTFCQEVNPNNSLSIEYFVKGTIFNTIGARYGIWEITEYKSIIELLGHFIKNEEFLYYFFENESIYKDRDYVIINNINNVWDEEVYNKIHQVIIRSFESRFYYLAENSDFIQKLSGLCKQHNINYLSKLISCIKNSETLNTIFYSLFDLLASLVEKEDVKQFIDSMSENGLENYSFSLLRQIKYSSRSDADIVFEEGRKYLQSEYDGFEVSLRKKEEKDNSIDRVYRDFQIRLKSSSTYSIFDFYYDNREYLDNMITQQEKERLIDLVMNKVFKNIDPGNEYFNMVQEEGKRKFKISHSKILFGNCILIADHLKLNVKEYRKKILNYVPFSFSEHLNAIFTLIQNITSEEIESLIDVYASRSDDRWRYMPRNFIRFAEKYKIEHAVPVLRKFVTEDTFDRSEREEALVATESINPNESFLKEIFTKYENDNNTQAKSLALTANKLLIEKHQNDEAIVWRFKQLIARAFPVATKDLNILQTKSSKESELNDKYFAAPILKLKEAKYEPMFFDLLEESFIIYKRKDQQSYATYLWEIVCSYFDNRKEERTYKPLQNLESVIQKHYTEPAINWFRYKLQELRRSYLNYIGNQKSINECIKTYNNLKSQQYLDISNAHDLKKLVKKILETEISKWLEGEGAIHLIAEDKIYEKSQQRYEELIQKMIKSQIENALLKRGFKDYDIFREPQLLSDKRTDFVVVSYGFIGSILIEVKLSKNTDLSIGAKTKLENRKSFRNMETYMKGYKDCLGIFLVIDNKNRTGRSKKWETHFAKIKAAYEKIENVEVVGIPCCY
ncbi:MAG: hypothetical protein GF353_20315 [Candidatus Lokiarchaeota archaeon]|nr:hypothetical protein [Candidatus Lokiarchaeota archaeon]